MDAQKALTILSCAHARHFTLMSARAVTVRRRLWQERDYLARYLSTREDDTDKTTVRLRASALAQGVDWTRPPEPMAFADRMAALMAPYRPQLDLFAHEEAS